MNNLTFDDVLDTNKYDCSTYFFSEIKNKQEASAHYNVLNDFTLPLSPNDVDNPSFKNNTIMHLVSMDVPTNLIRLDDVAFFTELNYGKRMESKVKQQITDIENYMKTNPNQKVPFYLATKKIVLYSDYPVLPGDNFSCCEILDVENMSTVTLNSINSILNYQKLYGTLNLNPYQDDFFTRRLELFHKTLNRRLTFEDFFISYKNKDSSISNAKYLNLKYLFDTNTNFCYLTNNERTTILKLSLDENNNVKQTLASYTYNAMPNYNFVWYLRKKNIINNNYSCMYPIRSSIGTALNERGLSNFVFFSNRSTSNRWVVQDFTSLIQYNYDASKSFYENLYAFSLPTQTWSNFVIYVEHPLVPSNLLGTLNPVRPIITNAAEPTDPLLYRPFIHIKVTPNYINPNLTVGLTNDANIASVDLDVYINNTLPIAESIKQQKKSFYLSFQIAFFLLKVIKNDNTVYSVGDVFNQEFLILKENINGDSFQNNAPPISIKSLWNIWNDIGVFANEEKVTFPQFFTHFSTLLEEFLIHFLQNTFMQAVEILESKRLKYAAFIINSFLIKRARESIIDFN